MYENKTLAHGRYKIVGALGEGGMAYVFTAYDTRLRVERAIKILAPRLFANRKIRERFESEAATMAQLHHKNILTIHDIGNEDQMVYMVMEMLLGGSLMDRIENHGVLHPRQAINAAIEMAAGLGFAHKNKVIHRDVKPHNVLISRDGVLKVADFGIARIEDGLSSQTRTGAVMGTLAYMAPEQKLSARKAETRSDLYAVAASLYVMLTNDNPFELYDAEIQEEKLGDIIPDIADFIRKGCHFSPGSRHQDADEMIFELEKLRDVVPPIPEDVLPLFIESQSTMTTQQKESSLYPMWDTMMSEISSDSVSSPSASDSSETVDFDLFTSEYDSSATNESVEEITSAKTVGLDFDDSISVQKTVSPQNPPKREEQNAAQKTSSSKPIKNEGEKGNRLLLGIFGAVAALLAVVVFAVVGGDAENKGTEEPKSASPAVVETKTVVVTKTVVTTVEPKKVEQKSQEASAKKNEVPPKKESPPVLSAPKTKKKTPPKPKVAPAKSKPERKPKVEEMKSKKAKDFGFVSINARPMRGLTIKINGIESKKPLRSIKIPVGRHAYAIKYKGKIKKGTIEVGKDEEKKICWNFLKDKKCRLP